MQFKYNLWFDKVVKLGYVSDKKMEMELSKIIKLIDKYLRDKNMNDYKDILIQLKSDLIF